MIDLHYPRMAHWPSRSPSSLLKGSVPLPLSQYFRRKSPPCVYFKSINRVKKLNTSQLRTNVRSSIIGCSSIYNELYVVISGNDEAEREAEPALFPNPSSDRAYLHLPAPQGQAGMAHIRSMEGRFLRSQALPPGQVVQELPLSGLPAGLYIVEAFDGKGRRMMVSRLVKGR